MVCDSFSITVWDIMTSNVNYIDFTFLNGVIAKFSVFLRNWPAYFENASFLYEGFAQIRLNDFIYLTFKKGHDINLFSGTKFQMISDHGKVKGHLRSKKK